MPASAPPPPRGVSVPTSTSAGNEAQGWLFKKSGIFSLWKQKFFVLRGPLLSYYDKFPSEDFAAAARLSDCTPLGVIRVVHVEAASSGFKVYGSSGKVVHVRSDTASNDKRWMDACRRAAAALQRRKQSDPFGDSYMCTVDSVSDDAYTTSASSTSADAYDHSGWLRCDKGAKFFAVQGTMLTMYDNKQPWCVPTYRGYVCAVAKTGDKDFRVVLSGGKTFHLAAASPDERDEWAYLLYQCTLR
ncbi:Aste57867_9942 [Aphanomyces stellatus]|uniref:Aste57867_9942 protein n=1 Tax=Aphanomyces stellatus TaxID=120398 RepID=A0A485KPE1_9STRA|nr:hypothetical protein As57867_009903 [Aphanomyces stellatus]VFT86820.1 Aste57867_9942 [Aphanomyces stellatus]